MIGSHIHLLTARTQQSVGVQEVRGGIFQTTTIPFESPPLCKERLPGERLEHAGCEKHPAPESSDGGEVGPYLGLCPRRRRRRGFDAAPFVPALAIGGRRSSGSWSRRRRCDRDTSALFGAGRGPLERRHQISEADPPLREENMQRCRRQ